MVPSVDGQIKAMRQAYEMSGLQPADIEVIECHATGTQAGDAAEIRSCAEIFAHAGEVRLGCVKSNLGHTLTAAGAVALIKILKSMEHGERAAIRGLDQPQSILAETALTPDITLEKWPRNGVRRAAINAFGFGGCNAHLIVEEPPANICSTPVAIGKTTEPVAIIAAVVRSAHLRTAEDIFQALDSEDSSLLNGGVFDKIALPIPGLAFPPKDLEHSFRQQTSLLEASHLAVGQVRNLPTERTSVYVGLNVDADFVNWHVSLRLDELLDQWGISASKEEIEAARQRILPGPDAAAALGALASVGVNRLNRQYNFGGASFTVWADKVSGPRCLELALHSLQHHECDAALIGAVDLSHEPLHMAAVGEELAADGACVMILKRLNDAIRDRDSILAVMDSQSNQACILDWTPYQQQIRRRLGVSHVASSLVDIAIAALSLGYSRFPEIDAIKIPATSSFGINQTIILNGNNSQKVVYPKPAKEGIDPAAVLQLQPHPSPVIAALNDLMKFQTAEFMAPAPSLSLCSSIRPISVLSTAEEIQCVPERPSLTANAYNGESDYFSPIDEASFAEEIANAHIQYLQQVGTTHKMFLAAFSTGLNFSLPLANDTKPSPIPSGTNQQSTAPIFLESTLERNAANDILTQAQTQKAQSSAEIFTPPPTVTLPKAVCGPQFSHEQLITLAGGRVADVFGEGFAFQENYPIQVRMPLPPLLLVDRVTGIDAPPLVLGCGTMWTETDVPASAWYLHAGRMPAGITLEAGQADLLLISWMGIDRLNKGERAYRLLGGEMTFHGPLPKIGDKLVFKIHVDDHASVGDVRMFFFHYELHIDGELRLAMRNGRAGFFTKQELEHSEGVLWDASLEPAPHLKRSHDSPRVRVERQSFDRNAIQAFSEGRMRDVFGDQFIMTCPHTRTPTIPKGRLLMIDEVTHLDPEGGPWKRGYCRSVQKISPSMWFFEGHFHNDPCMPGTLMVEGAAETMTFYMTALGCTIKADGWRFEPVKEQAMYLQCRGQCTPQSREVVYELFIEEFNDGLHPRLRATVLGSVDGRKAFLCRGFALELVPDWPFEELFNKGELKIESVPDAWVLDGFRHDHHALLRGALGSSSGGFGPKYRPLDQGYRFPRLPSPPYHCMTRIVTCDGLQGQPRVGTKVESEFVIKPADWFFHDAGTPQMPIALFLEVVLQPCGWLACLVRDLTPIDRIGLFRNLDGDLEWIGPVTSSDTALRVRVELKGWAPMGPTILASYRATALIDNQPIAHLNTTFGYFPEEAFEEQPGLAPSPLETQFLDTPAPCAFDLRMNGCSREFQKMPLPSGRLRMLDQVTGWWPESGESGLGVILAIKDIDPSDWFFKAHFMADPVQPGSLGVEALAQLLRCGMWLRGEGANMDHPEFEPVALGHTLEWKFRGQVLPTHKRITTLVEILSIERTDTSAVAIARGSLFVDGKKIYNLSKLSMRIRNGSGPLGEEGEASGICKQISHQIGLPLTSLSFNSNAGSITSEALPLQSYPVLSNKRLYQSYWHLDRHRGVLSDLDIALTNRYIRTFRIAAPIEFRQWRSTPMIICSNHQTALESGLFTILYETLSGLPVTTIARVEHGDSWVSKISSFRESFPSQTKGIKPHVFFDRNNPQTMVQLLADFRAAQNVHPHSLHIHIEGEQALSCRHRVERMSSVFIDIAIENGMAILPVRFSGGLPVTPLNIITNFPYRYGQQDIVLGAPLSAGYLKSVPRNVAVQSILSSINSAYPGETAEQPLIANDESGERIAKLQTNYGIPEPQAAIIAALQDLEDPCPATRELLANGGTQPLKLVGVNEGERAWIEAFSIWLWSRDSDAHRQATNWKQRFEQ
ncbi:MAG: beta-ketoacyl synthase N-terminal-like domain-containing protein [Verrucomicrobiota bacterium]